MFLINKGGLTFLLGRDNLTDLFLPAVHECLNSVICLFKFHYVIVRLLCWFWSFVFLISIKVKDGWTEESTIPLIVMQPVAVTLNSVTLT